MTKPATNASVCTSQCQAPGGGGATPVDTISFPVGEEWLKI